MNKLRTIINALLLTATVSLSAQTVNESIKFDEKIHDFGTIEETGGKVTHKFKFTNTGKEPAVILYARAGCSCVTAEVPKNPVKPGQSGYVTVTFNPDYRPGHFSKEIMVASPDQQYNRIWIKGDVKPGVHSAKDNYKYSAGGKIYMNYRVMNFGTVKTGQTRKMELNFGSDRDEPVKLDFKVENPDAGVTVLAGYVIRPNGEGAVEIAVSPSQLLKGAISTKIIPIANGTPLTPIQINYTAN